MAQLSLKSGIKQWGEKSRYSMKSKMRQLHIWNTFEPSHQSDLTNKEKSKKLEYHMFLKLKIDVKIKLRTVADSGTSSQRKAQVFQKWK